MTARLQRQDSGGLCTLTLNRPDKLNALDGVFFDELETVTHALEAETDSIGCIVLRAEGRAFSAGADLDGVGVEQRDPRRNGRILERFANLPQPIVASVQGICYTGGLELALACDFIVAEAGARFADTHGKWGFVPMWGLTQRLPRRIGTAAAKRMMMSAQPIGAADALRIGLIDVVADTVSLQLATAALVDPVLKNSWFSNFAYKRMIAQTRDMPLSQGLAYETHNWPGSAPDSSERIAAFTKK